MENARWRQLIGPVQELRSDICIFIISPRRARQGREGGRGSGKREAKKDWKKLRIIDWGLFCVYLDYNNRNVSWAKMQSGKLKNQD